MPIHDWTRVEAGVFHHFHHTWITEIQRGLNRGLLPAEYYALAEQIAGGFGPDVLTLQGPSNGVHSRAAEPTEPSRGVALATCPPAVEYRQRTEADIYAGKTKAVVIRRRSHHKVIAVIEIVSPGNKSHKGPIRSFVEKAAELVRGGLHLVVVDLFPAGPRDPEGLHRLIWEEFDACDFVMPADRRLTLASYIGGPCPEAFVQPTAVGQALVDMPLFLDAETYIPLPLEATYQSAWADVPAYWQDVLTGASDG